MRIKGQDHCLTLTKGNSDFKIKTCFFFFLFFFSETVGPFQTKFHVNPFGKMGMKTNSKKCSYTITITSTQDFMES